jgi:molybdopterin-guanine dinucleotide biosynthesis protein A
MRGAILAGGMATRFDGKPKGLEVVGGERILNRTADILKAVVGSPPLLVANAPDADTWYPGLEVTKDLLPERGSLGGIYTALAHGDGPVLLLAWDMPFVSLELLVALRDGSSGHDVFLPESRGPRGVEPLCGVYGPACVEPIRKSLDREDLRVIGFHSEVRAGSLPLAQVEKHGDPEALFFNVNSANDLAEAEDLWRRLHA